MSPTEQRLDEEENVQQLAGLDASFLALESPTSYAHVGSVCVLEPPVDGQPLTLEKLTRLVESRLFLVPPLRRRLAEVPLGLDQPYWIEDPDFDIEFHVRELALPAPGDDRQLAVQAARLHSRPLDRRRPLWELYLIHGLQGGRYGVYTKVHHAAIDGASGNDLLGALLDQTPEPRDVRDPGEWKPDAPPSGVNMLARSAVSAAKYPARLVKFSADVIRAVPGVLSSAGRPSVPVLDQVLRRESDGQPMLAPATPFNTNIGPHRRWVFGSVPVADAKAVKNAAGATVNDVVMSLCAAALRSWLQRNDALPEGPLLAAVPVSIRTEDQRNTHGNRVVRDQLLSLGNRLARLVSGQNETEPPGVSDTVLSPRELDVLATVALGCSNAEVARRLSVKPETVKSYLRTAMNKLGVHSRHEAVVTARRLGLLP